MAKLVPSLALLCVLLTGCTGGQTGDFGSSVDCGEPVPVPDDIADEFALAEALALPGEHQTTLRWRDLELSQDGPPFVTQSETRLQITLSLGTPGFFGTDSVDGAKALSSCRRISIPLQAEVEAEDGSIKQRLTGEIYRSGDRPWRALAWHAGSGPGQENVLAFSLYPDGPRGDLDLGGMGAYGTFPADACGNEGMPIEPSFEQPWLDGRSLQQLVDQFTEAFTVDGGVAASWHDGSTTQLTLQVSLGSNIDPLCGGPPTLWLPLTGRLRSADERLDVEFDRGELHYARGAMTLTAGNDAEYFSATLAGSSAAVTALTGHALLNDVAKECVFWPPRPASSERCLDLISHPR